ncbi:MAG: DUF433 domain-containing protein [Patescibacteria group bacterium]
MKMGGIEINPKIMVGQPVIAGTRIPVYVIIDLLADGLSDKEIMKDYYPNLTKNDIQQALRYSAKIIKNEEITFLEKPEKNRQAAL